MTIDTDPNLLSRYYYTSFVGDPNDRATIKGSEKFKGIALVDTDYYIPGANGSEWYINQNQFYRQIKNLKFDLTAMPRENRDRYGMVYAPTGLHWQVAQATSLQNLHFEMPTSTEGGNRSTAVGIFMENGSGGFISDLVRLDNESRAEKASKGPGQLRFLVSSKDFYRSGLNQI